MKSNYEDIFSRIAEEPKWYDQNGCPRYDDFRPELCPDIYSHQVVLLKIACQECRRIFFVEMHKGCWESLGNPKKLHYGDPPNHNCVGDTMNCFDLEVVEAWYKDDNLQWKRKEDLEGEISESFFNL